ncbi:MAG: DUF4333 domain-containing protein [Mycobacterium sp.]|nr:DUF4333 domain-containing protein [Mycobacterium sp.]
MQELRLTAAAAVAVGLSGFLAGCADKAPDVGAPVSAADLQRSLTERLTQAGTPPRAVTCAKDLPEAPGRSVRCNVEFGPAEVVTAVVTKTTDGYEITGPELSKEQLAARVRSLVPAQAAVCETGLKGSVESWARCSVTAGGVSSEQIVEVTALSGLNMELTVVPALPKQLVEQRLSQELAGSGMRPEAVECTQDLLGVPGTTITCLVLTTDGARVNYELTASGVRDGQVEFSYSKRPGRAG